MIKITVTATATFELDEELFDGYSTNDILSEIENRDCWKIVKVETDPL
jgi:hypothetical protein